MQRPSARGLACKGWRARVGVWPWSRAREAGCTGHVCICRAAMYAYAERGEQGSRRQEAQDMYAYAERPAGLSWQSRAGVCICRAGVCICRAERRLWLSESATLLRLRSAMRHDRP